MNKTLKIGQQEWNPDTQTVQELKALLASLTPEQEDEIDFSDLPFAAEYQETDTNHIINRDGQRLDDCGEAIFTIDYLGKALVGQEMSIMDVDYLALA